MGKKKIYEERESDPNIVLVTSLFLLLLCFFILLNSIAVIDEARKHKALNSLVGTFGIVEGGMPFQYSLLKFTSDDALENVNEWIKTLSVIHDPVYRKIHSAMEAKAMRVRMLAVPNDYDINITFPEALMFAPGSDTLSESALDLLEVVTAPAREYGLSIELTGYAEADEPGSASPWDLSMNRSIAAARALMAAGVKAEKLRVTAKGTNDEQVDINSPNLLTTSNRRVVVTLNNIREGRRQAMAAKAATQRRDFWTAFGLRNPFRGPSKAPEAVPDEGR
ncbi:MAG: OmpA family protein [Deltaproteobacteria bacterium]|nr:OmpA family protein [bacterium]MCB9477775.1 OmpA family protein [Deltaproteobacteria bacterium]MCB9488572.1 OmpA family protein [Deltaproteobacteria bacterium]